jgi:ATP-binding cassette subfamily B protein
MREQLRSLAVILRTMAAADRRLLWTVCLLAPLHTVFWAAFMLISRALVDAVAQGDDDGTLPLVLLLGATMAAWPVWWHLIVRAAAMLQEKTNREFERRLIVDGVRAPGLTQHESPEYLDGLRMLLGQSRDLGNPFSIVSTLSLVSLLAVSVALLVSVDPLCALLLLFTLPCVLLTTRVERTRVANEAGVATAQRLRQKLFSLQTDPGPAKEVKVLGLGSELRRRHRQVWWQDSHARAQMEGRGALLIGCGWAIFAVGLAGALWLLVWRASRGEISAGDVMLFAMVSQALSSQVAELLTMFASLQRSISAGARYRWLEDFVRKGSPPAEAAAPVSAPSRIDHGLALEHVTFAYPGASAPVLVDVSLELPPGVTVAVVGENGAGKTTLVKLLCRLYEPTRGRVTVDGLDLASFDPASWRSRLSGAFQDFVRFELVARESIGVGDLPLADDAASVRRALADAGASDIESRLPDGLETQLGGRWRGGIELSGGQWQRLALGRGFMRTKPLLLVLDEPTASLDAATEHRLFERFAAAARTRSSNGAITLFVSHRFTTVRAADLILVVQDGGIAEQGTHDELVRACGIYAELYALQAHAYRGAPDSR